MRIRTARTLLSAHTAHALNPAPWLLHGFGSGNPSIVPPPPLLKCAFILCTASCACRASICSPGLVRPHCPPAVCVFRLHLTFVGRDVGPGPSTAQTRNRCTAKQPLGPPRASGARSAGAPPAPGSRLLYLPRL